MAKNLLLNNFLLNIILAVVAGGIIRLLYWHFEPVISRDGIVYIQYVQIWLQEGTFSGLMSKIDNYWIPPLFLWGVKILAEWGITPEYSGIIISLLAGVATIPVIYGISNQCFSDRRIGLGSAWLLAMHPSAIEISTAIQRDSLYFFLCGLVIYWGMRIYNTGHIRYAAYLGGAWGLALMTRFESLEFFPLGIIFSGSMLWQKRISWWHIFTGAAVIVAIIAGLLVIIGISLGDFYNMFQIYYTRGKRFILEMRILFQHA